MKKAFTLVELLVVVVVITTLLAITFRLVGIGDDATRRNVTIARMQRLENALSGYFAAFGSYPPVALHASRNVYAELDSDGRQKSDGAETAGLVWESVQEACLAQPVGARFPFLNDEGVRKYIETISAIVVNRVNSNDSAWDAYKSFSAQLGGGFKPLHDPNEVSGWDSDTYWQDVKIFQFGVMSFLLPRYMFMTLGIEDSDLENCAQWNSNNRLSSHPNTGSTFGSWRDQLRDARLVRRIPSQAVCARWMPNLEKIVSGNVFSGAKRFFGIDVCDGTSAVDPDNPAALAKDVYVEQSRTILDTLTVKDGWGFEFYYYSPQPFQSYRLWSAGPNGKTFPPWMPFRALKSDQDRRTAANWMADDIMYLSN